MRHFISISLIVTLLAGCASSGYVYEGGKRRKVKRWEVKEIRSVKAGGNRPCSEEW